MRYALWFSILIAFLLPGAAKAQEIVSEPICFTVRNEAPYKIYGSFTTDYYTKEDGTRARHRSNFRLEEPGGKADDGTPGDKAEFCSYGPFLPGRKLELTIRTLIPIFSCLTNIESGDIVIHGERKTGPEGGVKTWADCL